MSDEQQELFPLHTRTRCGDPETSQLAAEHMAPKMSARRKRVLNLFVNRGAMTDLELENLCEDHGSSYRTRRSELTAMGYIADSGERKLQHGTMRTIWYVTPEGRAAWRLYATD